MSATDLQGLVQAPEVTNGVAAEPPPQPAPTSAAPSADAVLDRRADVEAKTALVATLLQEVGCEGLLLVEPENFAWLTSGGTARGVLDPAQPPAVYCNGESRWIIASNVDSQRLFDEELDGLGFQLKEWPWHWGRDQLLSDLCQDRKIACDRPLLGAHVVADRLRLLRRGLSSYEQACLRVVGLIVSHALEATCRNLNLGETEREVAGQISHRLLHRGVTPLHVGVAADGRSRLYRHFAFTSTQIAQHAVLTTTARKYGLTVTASRSVSFGPMDPQFRQEHNAVCRVGASYLASTWPDAVPREILLAGRRIYLISGFEHEWMACPQGNVTGREPVELLLTPRTEDLFHSGWAVTWSASAGAASSCDTFLVTDEGPQIITPTEVWPLKRIRIQGAEFVRPDVLER
jgi:Xaa-Pro aminopeptidase